MAGKGDEVDVHRQQDQLNRHQDDDDVLAVDEDAQHAKHEQDRADGQIMAQSDRHSVTPCPVSGFSSRTASSGRLATCLPMFFRPTPPRPTYVRTNAPLLPTLSTTPASSKPHQQ